MREEYQESLQELRAEAFRDLEARIQPTPRWVEQEEDNDCHGEE